MTKEKEKTKTVKKAVKEKTAKPAVKSAVKAKPAVKKASPAASPKPKRVVVKTVVTPKVKPAAKKEHLKPHPVKEVHHIAAPVKEPLPKVVVEPVKPKVIEPVIVKQEIKEVIPAPVEEKPVVASPAGEKEIELRFPITVKDLSVKLQEKTTSLIKALMDMKIMATINQSLDEATTRVVCQKYGFKIIETPSEEDLALAVYREPDRPQDLKFRSPIVTLMGHVDHGKTSLLDAIRKSKVAESEHGGITQHIGAYRVAIPHGDITFLDTPGHEAFTAMRARGASITDIVILVVAADDGIMPQTREAIDHARAAGVSIIVAVNKIDKPQADLDRVKKQLGELGLMSEDWGGKTITVPVSAKTGEGIDNLLEMILLESQMLELKANPNRKASGIVLEGKMIRSRGPVATLLVKNGTLNLNDFIIVGKYSGKVKAMSNHLGHAVISAPPSWPVEVLGITDVPLAGDQFFAVEDEKTAKELALKRKEKEKEEQLKPIHRMNLEDLYSQIKEGKLKELKLIIKADMHGSLEAIKQTLGKIPNTEISLNIIHEGVGNVNTSDVMLALASNALILGFHIDEEEQAKELISKENQEVRLYNVIYELANDIRAALEGMLEPKLKKVFMGKVEIKKVMKLSRAGTVAGCQVVKGKISRHAMVSLVRNGEVVFEGQLSSLKRFKDDVREVEEGFECGITLKGFDTLQEGDVIEAYIIEKIARKL